MDYLLALSEPEGGTQELEHKEKQWLHSAGWAAELRARMDHREGGLLFRHQSPQ